MGIAYSLSLWVFFYEGFTGRQALKRSKELVKGYWWSVFGRITGFIFVIYIAKLIATAIPLTIINSTTFSAVWKLVIQIISFLVAPVFIIYSQLIFKELKRIKGESKIIKKLATTKSE